ncbi:MAG TPA: glycerol-3-phosphate dehydrogenase/oxidase [Anaerolineaceae bacterium]|nr:glycerol-3-phosphate dehydrogenase/oxidase [Anaerolineaceae bacterium]
MTRLFDLIVIGGGITGAGIFREASRAGLRVLLVEANDFASGSSSRSAKLVHGGLRYLANLDFKLTLESVRERERLLKQGQGLVMPIGFFFTDYAGDWPPGWLFGGGLVAYDLLALRWRHRHIPLAEVRQRFPYLRVNRLQGGYHYFDAQTDDARLVLRVIEEGQRDGCIALNYARVETLLSDREGEVCGVAISDRDPGGIGRTAEVRARCIINATGCWTDELRSQVGGRRRLRKLRGSHLLFSAARIPLTEVVGFIHPRDHRPMYTFPWEGATLLGTTDIDHTLQPSGPETDPALDLAEVDYLMEAADDIFPDLKLGEDDILATFSGIRPVIDTGQINPSKESRDMVLWNERGLLTVTGGKLTTFRLMAHQALRAVRKHLPGKPEFNESTRVLDCQPGEVDLPVDLAGERRQRMIGRYGNRVELVFSGSRAADLTSIGGAESCWAELRWSAQNEAVIHLDDLLLRRQRIGLTLPRGGLDQIGAVRAIAQSALGWDDVRWENEQAAYRALIGKSYSVPGRSYEEVHSPRRCICPEISS